MQQLRFKCLGKLSALENSTSNPRDAVLFMEDGHPDKSNILLDLTISQDIHFHRLSNISDLESSISNLREAVEHTNNGHPQTGYLSLISASASRTASSILVSCLILITPF
jgi:hypothetical protein